MANRILIYPLGNSDILFNKNYIERENFRKVTEAIYNELSNLKYEIFSDKTLHYNGLKYKVDSEERALLFPIFTSVIKSIKNYIKEMKFYFIYTDQKNIEENKQDTLYLYEIVKKFLTKRGIEPEKVKGFPITHNPTDLSILYNTISNFRLEREDEFKNANDIFIILGPGTPQMTTNLILNFMDFRNARFYYISRYKEGLKPIDFPYKVISKEIKDSVLRLIDDFNYTAANLLYKKLPDEERKEIKLIESLHHRTNFDFERAYNSFIDYYNRCVDRESVIEDLKDTLEKLKDKDEKELKKELYYEFVLRIRSERYLEAVAMIFRFVEEILMTTVEKEFNVKITSKDDFEDFKKIFKENKDLREYFSNEKRKINWENKAPTRITYVKLLRYLKNREGVKDKNLIEKVLSFYERYDNEESAILDLRNSTPFAHGFEGVSREKLEKAYKSPEIIAEEFKEIMETLGIKVESYNSDKFPFVLINNYLKERIKKN